jgi:hypothetical protein
LSYTWRKLNEVLALLPETDVKALLDTEMTGARRVKIIERLHQRYNTLRVARERAELLALATKS